MIELLNGLTETIHYGNSLGLRLFHNIDYEDFPQHWHMGIEMIMPVTAWYTVIAGKERYCLQEGDLIIINSGVLHGLEAPKTGERIILQFDPALLYTLKEMETLLALMPSAFCIRREEESELYRCVKKQMDQIVREYDEGKAFCEASIYGALIEMFVCIGRMMTSRNAAENAQTAQESRKDKQREYLEAVMKACDYMNHHYQEKLKLEEVAALVGFSKYHFLRIFKQCVNMTFYEYLNRRRIQCAEGLLYGTEMSVTDVAMNAGFSSMSAFDRAFKAAKGCSPSEYREKIRKVLFLENI
ncbi:MAG: AraC family transcriptional regulator [Eubacteriales bacterium]|nr:AraC family transcriptional regulator [Eubacteriales bacterium]